MGAVTPPAATRLAARPGGIPLGAVLLGMGAVAAAAVSLLHLDRLPFAVCMFKAVTGVPCMTCGTTRALGRLVAGDLPGALAQNPLAATFVLMLVPWGLADLFLMTRGQAVGVELSPPAASSVRVALVAAVLVNWAYLIATGR